MSASRSVMAVACLCALLLSLTAAPARAGCGCDKPPPPPAQVRPDVAYAGAPISFFSSALTVGQQYKVTFANGITGEAGSVTGQVALLRDLADGVYKPQLVVALPPMPLGPTRITVTGPGALPSTVLSIADADFTVAPDVVPMPAEVGSYVFSNYQAAVGRDGTLYLSLDMSAVNDPLVFEASTIGYALTFDASQVVFRNVQGFIMQRLLTLDRKGKGKPVPGMFVLPAADPTSSNILHYSRHEFDTYYLQHMERQPHAVDPKDPNWHLDGSRHVDHNHLILAVMARRSDGSLVPPGATSAAGLSLTLDTLFSQGLVGLHSVTVKDSAVTDSYSPITWSYGSAGDIFTNGTLNLTGKCAVRGNTTATKFTLGSGTSITGRMSKLARLQSFMSVKVPDLIPDLGTINLSNASGAIAGPGSFKVGDLTVGSGGQLVIDNSNGPVTLYVSGSVTVSGGGSINVTNPDADEFAVYVASNKAVNVTGAGSAFHGVIYAPTSNVQLKGNGQFFGSFVGNDVTMSEQAQVHFDESLRGPNGASVVTVTDY